MIVSALTPFLSQYSLIAPASGCSLGASSDAARRRSLASSAEMTSVTLGLPCVTVPVLSSATVLTSCKTSSASADFTSIPLSAIRPIATVTATGVASPSAHGQEITSTEIPHESAKSKLSPSNIHTVKVTSAIVITIGTKIPLTLSASFAIGAFVAPASRTSSIILASAVSPPTFSARYLKLPFLFMVAVITASPTVFSTGIDSPVSAASSSDELPSTITPSAGND